MQKLSPVLPSGFTDYGFSTCGVREYMYSKWVNILKKYGYKLLQTSCVERRELLEGKYGGENRKLFFHILNSSQEYDEKIKPKRGLRYDLTLSLSRYIATHEQSLAFPCKCYQYGTVWRAERTQKGRLKEFSQMDVDVIGGNSPYHEAEILNIIVEGLYSVGIKNFRIKYNHRLFLKAFALQEGIQDKEVDFCRWLDKKDKMDADTFKKGLESFLPADRFPWLLCDTKLDAISFYRSVLYNSNSQLLSRLLQEVQACSNQIIHFPKVKKHLLFSPKLVRGLDYYTGVIFEVNIMDGDEGSIIGGGRYDKLISLFGKKEIPSIGFSFGFDRIFNYLQKKKQLNLEKDKAILLKPLHEKAEKVALLYAAQWRKENIPVIYFPSSINLKKGLQYAEKNEITWFACIGEEELKIGKIKFKNMLLRSTLSLSSREIIEHITNS